MNYKFNGCDFEATTNKSERQMKWLYSTGSGTTTNTGKGGIFVDLMLTSHEYAGKNMHQWKIEMALAFFRKAKFVMHVTTDANLIR